jgi:hypothetical protein
MMRVRAVVVVAILAVLLAGSASTVPAGAAVERERVWGDGEEWEVLFPTEATVRNQKQPFYLIAPIVAGSPQSRGRWGFGPHDSVMGVPPHRQGAFTGPCVVLLLVPGPNAILGVNVDAVPDPNIGVLLVRLADTDGDGVLEPLTSVAAAEAAATAGLVAAFLPMPGGEPIAFRCPVRPLHG